MSENGQQHTYLAFRWTPAGYELHEESGELPDVGETVEADGTRWTVVKVAPSPLPNDSRLCAYLQS
jgi:hypothetical protein